MDLLIFIRFLSTGSFIKVCADLCNVSHTTAWNSVTNMIHILTNLRTQFIKFPNEHEFSSIERRFRSKQQFPGVIGCVDGTHVPILVPNSDIRETFRNRKGTMSLNVQMICNDTGKIYDVVSCYPGSAHDARIWNESRIKLKVMSLPSQYHILGDSAYPLARYLLKPIRNPQTTLQSKFINQFLFYF